MFLLSLNLTINIPRIKQENTPCSFSAFRPPFFVLASDGLYFKLTNQDVVEIVKEHLDDSDYGAEEVALEAAASKSSRDNIIVIVVRLKKYELETNLDVQIKEK